MSEIHAAIGCSQLTRLREFIELRRSIAAVYSRGLRECPELRPLSPGPEVTSNFYKFIAFLGSSIERSEFKAALRSEHGVGLAGEVYDTPLHRPVFKKLGLGRNEDFEMAEDLCRRHVCLPISAVMVDQDALRVVQACMEVLASQSS